MGGDVAHHARKVLLGVPGEVARKEGDFLRELHVALHLDFTERRLLVGGEARQQEGRNAHFEVARRAFHRRGDFAGGLHGESERDGTHVEGGGASRVPGEALHRERSASQHVVQRARGRMGEEGAHTL